MKWILAVSLVSSLALAQKKGSEVVATVGTKKITLEEFNRKYSEVKAQASINAPSKKLFLEDLIRYELGLQEAKKRNLDKDPLVIERIQQEMYKALLEKELGQKVQESTVSDKEMREYYVQNPQIRLSDILIEVRPGATDAQRAEAKKRATEILADVSKSKRPFDELARLYSDDLTTKNLGGDVGWQSSITLVPDYYRAALGLKLNEITDKLVETPYGFHIVKLTGKRSYEEATKREIRMAVFDVKRKIVFDQFFDRLKKQYKIDVNPKVVE